MDNFSVFPLADVQRLREEASEAGTLRRKPREGWSINRSGPRKVLGVFSSLRLKPGYALVAYQFRQGENGNASVWAVQGNAKLPPREEWS